MSIQDYADQTEQYLSDVDENELLEYTRIACETGEYDKDAYGILRRAFDEGVEALSPKQLTLLYKELIEKVNRKCAICGAFIEPPIIIGGIDMDTNLCSYHNYTA